MQGNEQRDGTDHSFEGIIGRHPSMQAIFEIIRAGTKRANVIAEETLQLAKKAMKLDFGKRTLA